MLALIRLINSHIICNCTITSAPGHDYGYSGSGYDCTTGFTSTNLVSHTLFSECLVHTLVWHVCLSLTNIAPAVGRLSN